MLNPLRKFRSDKEKREDFLKRKWGSLDPRSNEERERMVRIFKEMASNAWDRMKTQQEYFKTLFAYNNAFDRDEVESWRWDGTTVVYKRKEQYARWGYREAKEDMRGSDVKLEEPGETTS